jgi:protein gp37
MLPLWTGEWVMATKIEWVRNADGSQGKTWNPVVGCARVSEGCAHCYAERRARMLANNPKIKAETRDAYRSVLDGRGRWNGEVVLRPEVLGEPLGWKAGTTVFPGSMTDLFHPEVPFAFIAAVFGVMAARPDMQFLVTTKRLERAFEWMGMGWRREEETLTRLLNLAHPREWCFRFVLRGAALDYGVALPTLERIPQWPLPNVTVLGTMENQARVNERMPALLGLATLGWRVVVNIEPMLGPVVLSQAHKSGLRSDSEPGEVALSHREIPDDYDYWIVRERGVAGVIVGGESGPGARPMHPDWGSEVRDQCKGAGVPFFFKQWGEWFPRSAWEDNPELVLPDDSDLDRDPRTVLLDAGFFPEYMHRVGKKAAGRVLDGRTHDDVAWQQDV